MEAGVIAGGVGMRAGVSLDPGPLARLEELTRDAGSMDVIAARVAEGESLKSIARAWGVPFGKLQLWILGDDVRMGVYRNALIAAGFTEADEAKEIADEATPESASVAKLRADVRRWSAGKKAPEYFGERLEVMHRKAVPSEEALRARLASMLAASPWLVQELAARGVALPAGVGVGAGAGEVVDAQVAGPADTDVSESDFAPEGAFTEVAE